MYVITLFLHVSLPISGCASAGAHYVRWGNSCIVQHLTVSQPPAAGTARHCRGAACDQDNIMPVRFKHFDPEGRADPAPIPPRGGVGTRSAGAAMPAPFSWP